MENARYKEREGRLNELLRKERLLHGWSFRDVADHICCPDERLVRRWESGDVFPSSAYRQRLCQLFQKNAEELGLLQERYTRSPRKERQEAVGHIPEHVSQTRTKGKELPDPLTSGEDTQHVVQKTMKDMHHQRMLERVEHIWIKGVLEHSLGSGGVIPLKLHEDARSVENPWRLDIQEVDLPACALPCDRHIIQVYDASHGELLLLGEPGAGKTTLLLTLAADLLERAIRDDMHPIPVVFHLASWSVKKQPLSLWLIEELMKKYQVPRHLSQTWVEQDKLLLLLDGLDEVDPAAYEDCIAAINTYREDHGFVSLVVCSRYAAYFSQNRRLLLKNAVIIQPLTAQQIDIYLEQGGEVLAKLRTQFAHEAELQELVRTPLMLTILTCTYQGKPTDSLSMQKNAVQQGHLFHAYIQRMFQRRTSKQIYTKEQTLVWLSWLAKRMQRHHQSVFYIESLQFDDFSKGSCLQHIPVLLFGLMMAGFGWIEYGLFFGANFGFREGLLQGGLIAFCTLLLYILMNGFVFKKIKWLNVNAPVSQHDFWKNWQRWPSMVKRNFCLLIYGLSFGVPLGLLVGLIMGHIDGRVIDIAHGEYNLFILTVDFMLLGNCPETIQPVEALTYSWSHLRKWLIYCVSGGLVLSIVLWFFFVYEFEVMHALFLALIFGSGFACLLVGSVGMVSPRSIDKRFRLVPNEGIQRSIRNGLVLGGGSGGLGGLLFGLIFTFLGHPGTALIVYGIIPGISAFQIIGLRNGGYAGLQHFVLRFFLWRAGAIPWNYRAFLDYATERVFLQKVGGGYIFIHSLLLDHFAHLNLLPPTDLNEQLSEDCLSGSSTPCPNTRLHAL